MLYPDFLPLILHKSNKELYWTDFKPKTATLPLIVRTVGSHAEHSVTLPTGLPEYHIFITLRGRGELIWNDCVYEMSVGSVFFFQPHTPLYYRNIGKSDWDTLWLTFNTELPITTFTSVKPGIYQCSGPLLGKMLAEIRDLPAKNRAARSSSLLYRLLLSFYTLLMPYTFPTQKRELKGVELALDYIHTHYNERVTVQALAAIAGMSRTDFSRAFSRMYGIPPLAYMQKHRFYVITEYLKRSGNTTFEEISKTFGFSHPSQLYALFRKYNTRSPDKLRKNLQSLHNGEISL